MSAAVFIASMGVVASGLASVVCWVFGVAGRGDLPRCIARRDLKKIRLACLSGQIRRMR